MASITATNAFILLITAFIVIMIIQTHLDNRSTEVDMVVSQHDHHPYLVRNLPDKERAATLLSQIKEKLTKLITHLEKKYPHDPRINRIVRKFDPHQLVEREANSVYTSYTVNKGEKIVMCLRQRNETDELLDLNTMVFVALHELSHIMTSSIGHKPEFWDNFRFLLAEAISKDVGIYQYQPFHLHPRNYCGIVITDTPLK